MSKATAQPTTGSHRIVGALSALRHRNYRLYWLGQLSSVLAQNMAARLLEEGIYVIGFFFPVVAKGQARIRVQLSAAHEQDHLDKAIAAFTKVGKELGVLKEIPEKA